MVVAGIGWFGLGSRRYYATPRLIEPWRQVAERMVPALDTGDAVISNHPSLCFYLAYKLHREEKGTAVSLAGVWPHKVQQKPVYDSAEWPSSAEGRWHARCSWWKACLL